MSIIPFKGRVVFSPTTCSDQMWTCLVQSLGQEDPLEKDMATHSSILAWEIPWTEGPGGLLSTGSQRVGCHWSDLACTKAQQPYRRLVMSFMKRNCYVLYQIAKDKLRWKGEWGQETHLGARNVPPRPQGGLEPQTWGQRQGRDRHGSKSSLRTVVMN